MKNRLLLLITLLFTGLTASAQSWLWATQGSTSFGGFDVTEGLATATDDNGNSFLTGWFKGTVTAGGDTINSGSAMRAAFIIKYDKNGNVLWTNQSDVSAASKSQNPNIISNCVATDRFGNCYITGSFAVDTVTFGSNQLVSNTQAFFVVKYNSSGKVMWAKQVVNDTSSKASSIGYGIVVDKQGNVLVVGDMQLGVIIDTINLNAQGANFFVVKYDSIGNVLWAKQPMKVVQNVEAITIATDNFGDSYVSGEFSDTLVMGKSTLSGAANSSYLFTAKFDISGNVIWASQTTNPNGNSSNTIHASDIATDYFGGTYVIGTLSGIINFDTIQLICPYTSQNNMYVVKYDSMGKVLWAKASIEPMFAEWEGYSISADTVNELFISAGDNDQGPDSINFGSKGFQMDNSGSRDGNSAVFELNTYGEVLCGFGLPGVGDDRNCVSVSPSGNYVNFGGDLENNVRFGSDSLTYTGRETPLMARWNPCYVSNLQFTNNLIYSCITKTDTAIAIPSNVTPFSIIWNTIPQQTDDTAIGLTPGTYVASIIIPVTADTIYDTVIVKAEGSDSINVNNPAVCKGEVTTLIATGGQSYSWYPATGLSATTGSSVVANVSITTKFNVIGSSNGCRDTVQALVTVNPAPNKPTITVSVTGDSLISSAGSYNQWNFDGTAINDSTRNILIIKGHIRGYYSVTVTNPANGCTTTSDSTTSINQLSIISDQLSIYPNPFNNYITVKINSSAQHVNEWSLQLTDVLGRTLYTEPSLNYSNEIDLANLPAGVYFIIVTGNTARAVLPVVKQN